MVTIGFFIAVIVGNYIGGDEGILYTGGGYLALAVADSLHGIHRELKRGNDAKTVA